MHNILHSLRNEKMTTKKVSVSPCRLSASAYGNLFFGFFFLFVSFFIMTSFDLKTSCTDNGLKQKTIDQLGKSDLDFQEALKLVNADDIATLEFTFGQKKLLLHALTELNRAGKSLRLARRNQSKQSLSLPGHWQAMAV